MNPFRRSAGALALGLALAAATPAAGQSLDDPALDQDIDPGQGIAHDDAVLGDGHVDLGPRWLDDGFELMVHDDAETPSVWRRLDRTVLVVADTALRTVPDDPTFGFLGVEPGTEVHVVPQVQRAGVVWLGWNTQDPAVVQRIDRGVTLRLVAVDGPGDLVVYLQSGALGDPEVLWRTPVDAAQPIWVEVNTHTHANWVFTRPGTYRVQLEVAADLVDGRTLTDVGTLRVAVGDSADPAEALAAASLDPPPAAEPDPSPGGPVDAASAEGGASSVRLVAMVALGLAVVAGWTAARGHRARRRAEADR